MLPQAYHGEGKSSILYKKIANNSSRSESKRPTSMVGGTVLVQKFRDHE